MQSSSASDGGWGLNVLVPKFSTTKTITVRGDTHIGGLLLKLSESIDTQEKEDWSDYAIWWPERNLWLLRTRSTLDQYGVQRSSTLEFTTMHKDLNFVLPDLRQTRLRTNFSTSMFRVVIQTCKKLGVRYPEELSISRKLDRKELKRNQGVSAVRAAKAAAAAAYGQDGGRKNNQFANGNETSGNRSGSVTPVGTLERGLKQSGGLLTPFCGPGQTKSSAPSMSSLDCELDEDFGSNPGISVGEAVDSVLLCPKNYVEKARMNAGWLDSSRSLMEQGIREGDEVVIRYKFYNFYDLNPRYDRTRINQLYQQLRWSLMSGEYNCSDEEMLVFAALQVQVDQEMQKRNDSMDAEDDERQGIGGGDGRGGGGRGGGRGGGGRGGGVEDALESLEIALDGSTTSKQTNDIMTTPVLRDVLYYYRPKKMTLKSYRKGLFVLKDIELIAYEGESEDSKQMKITPNLKECEVSQTVNFAKNEFRIKLLENNSKESVKETFIRLESMEKYAMWLVALKFATKGRTMADSSYREEVASLKSILTLQQFSTNPNQKKGSPNYASPNVDPKSCIAPRFFKKMSPQEAKVRVGAIHSNICGMKLKTAQMEYIRAWQLLPESGNSYFVVKFDGQKKEELLAISADHLARLDMETGEPVKTWSYTAVENWSVNWDTRHVHLVINDTPYAFQCYTADCKIIHEYIGGYIFLMLRSPDKSQTLDEELFQKLTGGRE